MGTTPVHSSSNNSNGLVCIGALARKVGRTLLKRRERGTVDSSSRSDISSSSAGEGRLEGVFLGTAVCRVCRL